MAETFKNAKAVLADTATTIYTVPAGTTAIVIGFQVANIGTQNYPLDISWLDASDSNTETYLSEAIIIPDGSAYEPIGGKLVLEAGDVLRGSSNQASVFEATVSVLELT